MEIYRSYATALLELSLEEETADRVFEDSGVILSALAENGEYTAVLDTPALPLERRLSMIDESFSEIDENLKNMIKILAEGGRAHMLTAILREYISLYYEARGIIRAEAISAVALTREQSDALAKRLGDITGKTVLIDNKVDSAVLGGMKVRFLDRQIDGTVAGRLEDFERRLKDAVI